jgi:hypothetical protein
VREKRKGGGGKLVRSEVATIRFDPETRYLAELAARKQRRTFSSFVEWAVMEALGGFECGEGLTFKQAAPELWDVSEPDRVVRLGLKYPYLLNYEEQVWWKIVQICRCFWTGYLDRNGEEYVINNRLDRVVWQNVRAYWDLVKNVATGNTMMNTLSSKPLGRVIDELSGFPEGKHVSQI